jgi:formylglycine-generating enzyme required for sulfatase activity
MINVRRTIAISALAVPCGFLVLSSCGARTETELGSSENDIEDAGAEGPACVSSDSGESPPSCAAKAPGTGNCGYCSESCCISPEMSGGSYSRSYDPFHVADGAVPGDFLLAPDGSLIPPESGVPSDEGHPATVSSLRVDKYIVTVGRFRTFVSAWRAGWLPTSGAGKHSHLNGGKGLENATRPETFETGWVSSDDSNVAPTPAHLEQDGCTWTDVPGDHENLPIMCVNWYEAYAFCIWDGGFLPSWTEWDYASAGGSQQREFPWGSTPPGSDNQYAIFGFNYEQDLCEAGLPGPAPVGTAKLGAGRWGQLDLVGEIGEWVLDWVGPFTEPCVDCARLSPNSIDSERQVVGGNTEELNWDLLPSAGPGGGYLPGNRLSGTGIRCARLP